MTGLIGCVLFTLLAGGVEALPGFGLRILGTCAAFYPFFLCRMLGGGDIKLMALCVGYLGVSRGLSVLFGGFSLAAISLCLRLIKSGTLWARLSRMMEFLCCLRLSRKSAEYPGAGEKENQIRLAPYLAAGYLIGLILY